MISPVLQHQALPFTTPPVTVGSKSNGPSKGASQSTPALTTSEQPDIVLLQTHPLVDETSRLNKTQSEALALFQRFNTRESLLNVAKQFGLEIYDGGQQSWVDAYCLKEGLEAFVYTPFSKRYPESKIGRSEQTPFSTGPSGSQVPHHVPWYDFISHALNKKWDKAESELSEKKQSGLFFKKNVSPDILMHELFHVLQDKNGLPFGVNAEADQKANQFSNELSQLKLSTIVRRAGLMVLVGLNSLVQPLREPKSDVAKSLYYQMKREVEVDEFMMSKGHLIGLTPLQQLKHAMHYIVESQFKLRLSNLMDQAQNI